jgi:hypothetical protein
MFAVAGDLWVHGWDDYPTGQGTYWRISRDGYVPMLNKAGVHIFEAATDGTTLFWVEVEVGTMPKPRTEIWKAPFSKDPAAVRASARKVLDITGAPLLPEVETFSTPAHAGFYALPVSETEMVVVRGSDGATQRVTIPAGLPGDWGRLTVAYVDATQIWFAHGGNTAFDVGVARIELNPWP